MQSFQFDAIFKTYKKTKKNKKIAIIMNIFTPKFIGSALNVIDLIISVLILT